MSRVVSLKVRGMDAVEGFIFGVGLMVLVVNVIDRDWGDVVDGAVTCALFWLWSSERRRREALEGAVSVSVRYRR